jgi:hypothetical protein
MALISTVRTNKYSAVGLLEVSALTGKLALEGDQGNGAKAILG